MDGSDAQRVALALLIVTVAALVAVLLSWALLRAGKHPAPAMLVLSVSILSMTALIGGLVFNSDSALALAGAGIGALAGAVSSTFTWPTRPSKEDIDDHPR